MALYTDIPSLTPYATLDSPAFTGTSNLGGDPLLARANTLSPAHYNAGQHIELDFHSADVNTTGDYK